MKHTYIQTYMHNWLLQPFNQDYDLASHTSHVVSANFTHEPRNLYFKIDFEQRIFEKLFVAISFALSVFARNLLRSCPKYIFSYFVLLVMSDLGFKPRPHVY